MDDYISKWHKELEIFSKIKPLLILEGDVLDSYQYPQEGSTPKGSILRLSEYLHFFSRIPDTRILSFTIVCGVFIIIARKNTQKPLQSW